jgi:hypothetical protein
MRLHHFHVGLPFGYQGHIFAFLLRWNHLHCECYFFKDITPEISHFCYSKEGRESGGVFACYFENKCQPVTGGSFICIIKLLLGYFKWKQLHDRIFKSQYSLGVLFRHYVHCVFWGSLPL